MARRGGTDDSELNFSHNGWKIETMDDYFSLLFSLDKIQKIFELRLNDGLPAFSERDGKIILNVYGSDHGELRGHENIINRANDTLLWNGLSFFSIGPMPFQGMHANDLRSAIEQIQQQRQYTEVDSEQMALMGVAIADAYRGETDPAVSYGDPRCTYKMAQDFYKHLNALIIQTKDKSEAEKHEVLMKLGGVALGCFLDRNTVPHDLMEPFVCKHLLGLGVLYPPFPNNAIRFLRVTDETNNVWAFPHMTLDEIDTILTTMTGKPKFEALSLLAGSLSIIGAIKHIGPENVPDKLAELVGYATESLSVAALTCSAIARHTVSLATSAGSALTSPVAAGVFGAVAAVAVVDHMAGGRGSKYLARRIVDRSRRSADQRKRLYVLFRKTGKKVLTKTRVANRSIETSENFLRRNGVIASRTMDFINAAIQVLGLKIQDVNTLAPFTSRPGCMILTETPPEESPPSDSDVRELCGFKPGGNERRAIPPSFINDHVQRRLNQEARAIVQRIPRALRAHPRRGSDDEHYVRLLPTRRPALDGSDVAVDRVGDARNSSSSSSSSEKETRTSKPPITRKRDTRKRKFEERQS